MKLRIRAEVAATVAAAAVVAGFFWGFLVPVWDIDFWWHIATGRWIVEHGQVPATDPFGVFSNSNPVRSQTILRNYWGAQVVLYEIFLNFGIWGVVLLRAALLGLCLAVLYWRSRFMGAGSTVSLLLLSVAGFGMLGQTADRPQLLSFAFAALLFLLLDWREKTGARWPAILIPVLGVLWANGHGGVTLGSALLMIYLAADIAAPLFGRQRGARPGELAISIAAFIGATLLTPNGITTYLLVYQLQGSPLEKATSDYMSAFRIYQLGYILPQFWIGVFYLLALAVLPRLARKDLRQAALVIFLGAISAVSHRYFTFFLLVAAPYIAQCLTAPDKYWQRANVIASTGVAGLTLLLLASVYGKAGPQQEKVNQSRFPVGAVEYLRSAGSAGRVFNHINWGGYLLWQLDPTIKVFVDGRMLDDSRLMYYTHILWATPEGIAWLGQADFDFVILPYRNPLTGEYYPLHNYLMTSGGWRVLYNWEQGALYGRKPYGLR
ncbi:MAG: hypothetical protein NUV63_05365 [Gallionella sp.]|nr:hypothetical protein [Gallionella sp.]